MPIKSKYTKESLEYQREYREKNLERFRRYSKEQHARRREDVLRGYGGDHPHCVCCGTDVKEFLAVDHINGGGKLHLKDICNGKPNNYGNRYYVWLVKNNFPPGFQLLCHNCNFFKSAHKSKECPCKSLLSHDNALKEKIKRMFNHNEMLENEGTKYTEGFEKALAGLLDKLNLSQVK